MYRWIWSEMWTADEWFAELSVNEKLLWIYLFSNPHASISGIYRLRLDIAAIETGIPVDEIDAALTKFANDGKIERDGWLIWIVNYHKYQSQNSKTIKQRIAIDLRAISDCPLKTKYMEVMQDWLSSDDGESKSKSKFKSKSKSDDNNTPKTLLQLLDAIMPGRVTEALRDWLNDLVAEHGEDNVRDALIKTRNAGRVGNPKAYIYKILTQQIRDEQHSESDLSPSERKLLEQYGFLNSNKRSLSRTEDIAESNN